MIGLDVGQVTPEIARLLLLRGGGLPPLWWGTEPHRGAKKVLDESDDAHLFAPLAVPREDMAAAVRSLLYLWHGWTGECLMYGQAVPEPERFYLTGLCERQARRGDESKTAFKQVQDHAVFPMLMTYALNTIPLSVDSPLQRLREMLQMGNRWDPYLFTDAWMAGVTGNLRPAGETILRQIQCREFELLLAYLYEQATGHKIAQRRPAASEQDSARRARERERRMKEERRRREEKIRRQKADATPDKTSQKTKEKQPSSTPAVSEPQKPAGLRIRCPKCDGVLTVPLASRGKATRCSHCNTGFMVPGDRNQPAHVIGIICPKCQKRITLPTSARGKKAQCVHCAAVFVVPQAGAPTTPRS